MYSKEDKEQFRLKDLRINRVALLKSLIESGRNSANEIKENCEMADEYIAYIYSNKEGSDQCQNVDWVGIAKELNLDIPNEKNVKALDFCWEQCKKQFKLSANPAILISHIIDKYGRYPTTKSGVETIIKQLKETE